jgi:hypothetical protein
MAAAVSGSTSTNKFVDDRDYYLIETNGPFDLVDGYTTSLDFLEQQSLENTSQARAQRWRAAVHAPASPQQQRSRRAAARLMRGARCTA